MWRLNRRIILAVSVLFWASHPAFAGDRALVDVIGYSSDLRYFAFEEFGVQDGSGFAYASIYVVDTDADRWVVGTPVSVQAEDGTQTLAAVRADVRNAAAARLDNLAIHVPAQTLALSGDGAIDDTGKQMTFGLPGYGAPGGVNGRFTLKLSTFAAEPAASCAQMMDGPVLGFTLKLSDGNAARLLHRDSTIPRSRGCPEAYRIYGVFLPFNSMDIERAVALVSVYPHGFEGPDRRFTAIPFAAAFLGDAQ